MYLFVFIFVILSVMGVYTELFSLRMASMAAQQKVVAETMMFWHGGVYTFARDYKASLTGVPSTGCQLTLDVSVCGLPVFTRGDIGGKTYLPLDYNLTGDSQLLFHTVLFRPDTDYYVLTYVASNEVRLGYTADQIYRQMNNANLPRISYGRVISGSCLGGSAGHWLATNEYINGVQVCYTIPTGASGLNINDGAVGIISNIGS